MLAYAKHSPISMPNMALQTPQTGSAL